MIHAESVHSTPPTNTPISQRHPVDAPSRRRFLHQAAGVAAGGTVLAMATIPPMSAGAAPASTLDPMYGLSVTRARHITAEVPLRDFV
jgi:hypothetical protein